MPEVLVSVADEMSGMQFTDKDTMGDVYEELLKKMAAAVKRGLEAAERLYRQQMQELFGEAATKTAKTTKTTKTANAGGFSLSGHSAPCQGLNSPVGHRAKGGNANG